MKYRAEIDGLRALAVISVVIFHFFPAQLSLGYLGVDIFFVISGYLITAHLLQSQASPYKDYLKHFYSKRVKRLFPALFVFLLATTVLISAEMTSSSPCCTCGPCRSKSSSTSFSQHSCSCCSLSRGG